MRRADLYPWIGMTLGGGVSLFDGWLLRASGVQMRFGDADVSLGVWLVFAVTSASLGWALGAVIRARGQARADAETIRAQLEALRAARAEVARMEQLASLGRVAAGMAHEVRNPLGVIRSSAGLIREELPAGEAALACRFIEEEVDRLDLFVRRVLSLAGPAPLALEPVDLGQIAARALKIAEIDAPVEGAAPPAMGDPALLTQAALGLILNARQIGAERIWLRLGSGGADDPTAPRRPFAWLEVADDGPGVPDALRERIFEPLFTTRAEGTGLGLAMGARILSSHGGALRLMPGGPGARFRMQIPLDEEAA